MKPAELSPTSRYIILVAGFLGWMFSGVQMSLMNLASGSATEEFVRSGLFEGGGSFQLQRLLVAPRFQSPPKPIAVVPATPEQKAQFKQFKPRWYAFYNSGFLLGAAAGGLLFGWIADRTGRVRAMGASVLCYSLFAGAGYFAATPEQLLLCRFLSGMGVGGMWPTGVSLASEAWSDVSRPTLAGLLGTAANVGIVLMSVLCWYQPLDWTSWRWCLLAGSSSIILGVLVFLAVPESVAWLKTKTDTSKSKPAGALTSLLSPPLLPLTLIGIALGTIPLLGGWGVTSWLIPWTEAVRGAEDQSAKALTAIMRASGGAVGSLFGGWIANQLGRRTTYFLISLGSFGLSEFIFLRLDPSMTGFSAAVFAVGCVSTVFFGWLPLYLPELFPTHARATGSGISVNFGRILTAVGVLGTGTITSWFQEDYARAGAIMSLIYAAGMLVILLAPDTTKNRVGSE